VLAETLNAASGAPHGDRESGGGAGIVASELVPRAAADALRQHLPRRAAPNAPIDVTTAPVSVLSEMPTVMPVANNFPARDVGEFIALARPNPSPPRLGRTL
jgi:hypothetical protein